MITGGIPVTDEYQPEHDMELLQLVWAIRLLCEKTTPEHWERMKDILSLSLNRPQGSVTANADSFMTRTRTILSEVLDERAKQNRKWGTQDHDPVFWTVIATEELGEVARAAFEHRKSTEAHVDPDHWLREYRKEMVQVAAVAVAAIESLGRNELCEPPDFRQALGAIPLEPGMPTATEAIRKARDES